MKSLSLRYILPAIILVFVMLVIGISYGISRLSMQNEVVSNTSVDLKNEMLFLQSSIEIFVKQERYEHVNQLISGLAAHPELVKFFVADNLGRVIASSDFSDVGTTWASLPMEVNLDFIKDVKNNQSTRIFYNEKTHYLDAAASLCVFGQLSLLRKNNCGFIFYRINLDIAQASFSQYLLRASLYSSLGLLLVSIALALVVDGLVVRRVRRMVSTVTNFAIGERETRCELQGRDEIQSLSEALNQLFTTVVVNENLLADKEKNLEVLFAAIVDAIVVINDKGVINRVNPAVTDMFGYSESELIGTNVKLLMPESFSRDHNQYIENFLSTRKRKIIGIGREVTGMRKDGLEIPVELTISEVRTKGRSYFIGVLRDVSQRVRLERQLRAAFEKLSQMNSELEVAALTDGLTGLANRRHFDSVLRSELSRATRDGRPLSLLIVDVDYFKRYNDLYGHQKGDECLQQVSVILKDTFKRSGELVARYGGEEFAVILPDEDIAPALLLAERLLVNVAANKILHEESDVASFVTLSVGCACYQPSETTPPASEDIIKLADDALYKSKSGGRNRVTSGGYLS